MKYSIVVVLVVAVIAYAVGARYPALAQKVGVAA